MPRESFGAHENLSKQARCQVALGERQDKVPGMPDQVITGLEQPLLEVVSDQL